MDDMGRWVRVTKPSHVATSIFLTLAAWHLPGNVFLTHSRQCRERVFPSAVNSTLCRRVRLRPAKLKCPLSTQQCRELAERKPDTTLLTVSATSQSGT